MAQGTAELLLDKGNESSQNEQAVSQEKRREDDSVKQRKTFPDWGSKQMKQASPAQCRQGKYWVHSAPWFWWVSKVSSADTLGGNSVLLPFFLKWPGPRPSSETLLREAATLEAAETRHCLLRGQALRAQY